MVTGVAATPIDAPGAADRACVARSGADHRTGRCGPVPAASRPGRTIRSRPLLVLAAPAAAEVWSGLGRHRAEDEVRAGLLAAGHLALPPSGHRYYHPPGPHRGPGHVPAGWEHWRHRARQCPAATRAGTVVSAVSGHCRQLPLRRPPSAPAAPGGSPRRPGLPSASPRSRWPGSMTRRDCARTRRYILLPALAHVRAWDTVSAPWPRQKPGPALVALRFGSAVIWTSCSALLWAGVLQRRGGCGRP